MNDFVVRPTNERRVVFEQAAAELGLPAQTVEKDFWVCWTLRELFALPDIGAQLTFKGGTSLSKVWKLIDRFSEDIDLTFDRDALGFGGNDSPEEAPSGKQKRRRLDRLKAACQQRVHHHLKPTLEARMREALSREESWDLVADEGDPDNQTLLFHYPLCWQVDAARYVPPMVKLEFGARSDPWPVEEAVVTPMVSEALPSVLSAPDCPVRALRPERTFWEKAMLLHEETYRPAGGTRKARMARHYFDLWSLIRAGVAAKAVADEELFRRVAEHRSVYFRWTWMDYATLRKGMLRMVPLEEQVEGWRIDYDAMGLEMFAETPPPFDDVLNLVRKFEEEFNGS